MNGRLISAFIVGAAVCTAVMPVLASTCYEVIDRNNVVIFRDASSPVDLSGAGAPAREAMRSRGELLVIFDVETCVVMGRSTSTGGRTLTTDEVVAGWRPMPLESKSGWGTYSSRYGGLLPPAQTPTQPPSQTPSRAPSPPSGYR